MTRRFFFTHLFAVAPVQVEQKFYITGGTEQVDGRPRDDCQTLALVAYATSKEAAYKASGLQVWSALEYFGFRDRAGLPPCRKR